MEKDRTIAAYAAACAVFFAYVPFFRSMITGRRGEHATGKDAEMGKYFNNVQKEFCFLPIAQKIENEMEYPGQIKVCLIRENRATDVAK